MSLMTHCNHVQCNNVYAVHGIKEPFRLVPRARNSVFIILIFIIIIIISSSSSRALYIAQCIITVLNKTKKSYCFKLEF